MYRPMLRIVILLLPVTFILFSFKASAAGRSGLTGNPLKSLADTTVRGRIVDSAGNAIPGVSVLIRKGERGTTTDANGNFTLNNVPARATLVISSIGYHTREIRLAPGQAYISI